MLNLRRVALVAVLLSGATSVGAQIPDTDIWLATIRWDQGAIRIDDPVNVTHRPGYDNQPAFLYYQATTSRGRMVTARMLYVMPEPGFLYSSADSSGATDVFQYNMKESIQITHTPESEYSPTPLYNPSTTTPTEFCSVRVEADGTQRLWRFNIDGSNPTLVMTDVDSIGYFAWMDDRHLAVFVLGNEEKKEPHTLRVVDVLTQSETIVARGIGRSILPIPGREAVSFTMQDDDESFRFFQLELGRNTGEPLVRAVGGGQDGVWLDDDTMLMSAGTAIHVCRPGSKRAEEREWRLVHDFADLGIAGITRMALGRYTPPRIAFVATMTAPEGP